LRLQNSAVDLVAGKSRLFLSEPTAAYIRDLHQLSAANGFSAGDPVIDLTGVSPGSLYVMGARPLGVAWTLGRGYPGSGDFLTAALDDEACEAIAASWILTEPGSADSFSPEILGRSGIDVSGDYLQVGTIRSTRGVVPKPFEHRLLKPARSPDVARKACEEARRMRANSSK
jgi:hypothetical protein